MRAIVVVARCAGRGRLHFSFGSQRSVSACDPAYTSSCLSRTPLPPRSRLRAEEKKANAFDLDGETCPDAAKEVRPRERRRPAAAGPGCSSPWGGSTVFSGKATTRSASVPGPRSILPPLWNIWRPKCSSWLEMPPGTTKRLG